MPHRENPKHHPGPCANWQPTGGFGTPCSAPMTFSKGAKGLGREDSENSGRRRPGLGDVMLVWQARVKSRDYV